MWSLLAMIFRIANLLFAVFVGTFAAPEVKLHGTTLVGRDVTTSKVDFFGGEQGLRCETNLLCQFFLSQESRLRNHPLDG